MVMCCMLQRDGGGLSGSTRNDQASFSSCPGCPIIITLQAKLCSVL